MKSKQILNNINWIVTFISVIVAIIVAVNEQSFTHIFKQPNAFNSLTVILLLFCITTVFLIARFIFDKIETRLEKENAAVKKNLRLETEEHRKTSLQLANCKRLLYDIDIERYTDVITGIPNQLMFKLDVQRITESIKQGELYQIIMIDIDDFSFINKTYGYFKGDEFIRSIAEELYYTIRRNENIYKKKFIPNDEPLTESVYRKYNGGDEFLIILKGTQDEAVGFVTRLHRQLTQFSQKSSSILPKEFNINFHGGIAPLYANDDADIALSRVEECFWIAKRPESEMRVKWFKNTKGSESNPLYINAVKEFTKPPNHSMNS